MSTCVSMNGEFDNHTLDDDFICGLCFALDEDALIDQRDNLRATVDRVAALVERADPPGRMKAGTPTVSVALLRTALAQRSPGTTKATP